MTTVENQRTEQDHAKLIKCNAHVGATIATHLMKPYVFRQSKDGANMINIAKMHDKILVAARVCVTVANPRDILVVSQRADASRAIFKFGQYVGAEHQVSRWTAGTLTNQITKQFREPSVMIVADPRADAQAVREAHYANVPVIALCNTDSPLANVDVAIPCNNKNIHSLGLVFWMLAREILYLRGDLRRTEEWDVVPDLFFYKDPKTLEKEDEAEAEAELDGVPAEEAGEAWEGNNNSQWTD